MVDVAFRAVDGGSRCRMRCATGAGRDPGHWWPAPATVMSSTARPSGHVATDVVTGPDLVSVGAEQEFVRRQVSISDGTEGPSILMGRRPLPLLLRRPGPPAYGMVG